MYFSCCSWRTFAEDLASKYNALTSSRSTYTSCQHKNNKNLYICVTAQHFSKVYLLKHNELLFYSYKSPCNCCLGHSFSPHCWQVITAELQAWGIKRAQKKFIIVDTVNRTYLQHNITYKFNPNLKDERSPISLRNDKLSSSTISSSTCARIAKIWQ